MAGRGPPAVPELFNRANTTDAWDRGLSAAGLTGGAERWTENEHGRRLKTESHMKPDGKLLGVNALMKGMGSCRCCLRFRRDAQPKKEIPVCRDGLRSNLMSTVTLVLLAASLLLGTPAAAADAEAPKPSLAKLAQEFTDPLTTLPQIFTQNVYTPTNFGTDAPANRLIGRMIIPRVPESALLPFVQLIRPSVSLVTVPTGTGSGTRTAFGDMQLFDLAVLPWPDRESGLLMGVGPVFVFPTATEKTAGQGAW